MMEDVKTAIHLVSPAAEETTTSVSNARKVHPYFMLSMSDCPPSLPLSGLMFTLPSFLFQVVS